MPDSYGYGYSDALRTRGELAPVTSFSSQSTYAVSTNKPQNFTEKDRLLCRKTMRQIFPFLPAPLRAAAFTSADRGNARENRVRPAVKLLHPHTLSSQADCPANIPPFFLTRHPVSPTTRDNKVSFLVAASLFFSRSFFVALVCSLARSFLPTLNKKASVGRPPMSFYALGSSSGFVAGGDGQELLVFRRCSNPQQ